MVVAEAGGAGVAAGIGREAAVTGAAVAGTVAGTGTAGTGTAAGTVGAARDGAGAVVGVGGGPAWWSERVSLRTTGAAIPGIRMVTDTATPIPTRDIPRRWYSTRAPRRTSSRLRLRLRSRSSGTTARIPRAITRTSGSVPAGGSQYRPSLRSLDRA